MEDSNLQRAIASIAKVSEIARRDMFEPESNARERQYPLGDHGQLHPGSESKIWHYFFAQAQDRLVRIVLWARELGVLHKTAQSGESQPVITSQGRIWSDLPFFVPDVQEAWKKTMRPDSPISHRYNLAAGIARLASLRVCNNAFAECGLEVMKDALETPQELSSSACLLLFQPVYIWLRYAGDQLLLLSLARLPAHGGWASEAGAHPIGSLAQDAGIEGGFSKARFIFWKERLVVLRMEPADEIEIIL
ncbi:hypothetical protein F4818DRAFT_453728 [Hypoxylon cercidicola]|nr:hypothetical protein F4818DRAFT_453728 [Hypoxylon cercidicola]